MGLENERWRFAQPATKQFLDAFDKVGLLDYCPANVDFERWEKMLGTAEAFWTNGDSLRIAGADYGLTKARAAQLKDEFLKYLYDLLPDEAKEKLPFEDLPKDRTESPELKLKQVGQDGKSPQTLAELLAQGVSIEDLKDFGYTRERVISFEKRLKTVYPDFKIPREKEPWIPKLDKLKNLTDPDEIREKTEGLTVGALRADSERDPSDQIFIPLSPFLNKNRIFFKSDEIGKYVAFLDDASLPKDQQVVVIKVTTPTKQESRKGFYTYYVLLKQQAGLATKRIKESPDISR